MVCGVPRHVSRGDFAVDDGTDGYQMRKREGLMSDQVHKDELLSKTLMVEKEWYCRFSSENERVDKSQVSEMQNLHSRRVAWVASAGLGDKECSEVVGVACVA